MYVIGIIGTLESILIISEVMPLFTHFFLIDLFELPTLRRRSLRTALYEAEVQNWNINFLFVI